MRPAAILAAVAAVLAALTAAVRSLRRTRSAAAHIQNLTDETRTHPETGAVTSVQGADVLLPPAELERMWTPMHLERLARTYWRFLSRCTLEIIRVKYTPGERTVCVLFRPFALLTFQRPEYEMNAERGIVRWRIEKGLLVSKRGRGGDGYLEIEVRRCPSEGGLARLHVEVEVNNFYPSLASGIGTWFYANTQSRIHVLVTHGFLRSLARLDLAESRVGTHAQPTRIEDVPDPVRERDRAASAVG
jgi:hypothetical protein